jgi:hypothetical protein
MMPVLGRYRHRPSSDDANIFASAILFSVTLKNLFLFDKLFSFVAFAPNLTHRIPTAAGCACWRVYCIELFIIQHEEFFT